MARAPNKTAPGAAAEDEDVRSPTDAAIDSVTLSQQEALQTMENARTAMMEGLGRVQREIADFVSERVRKDMETQQAFLRCKTIGDVRAVQTEFFRTAMDQYAAEANRLMKLGSEMMAKSMERDV